MREAMCGVWDLVDKIVGAGLDGMEEEADNDGVV